MCLDSDKAMGNMGMLDQVMGLRWVQKYIHLFGGDKDQVTIFGESAGSASITHLLLSNLTDVRITLNLEQYKRYKMYLFVRPFM